MNLIEEITALIVAGGQLAFQLYLKLEPLLNLGSDEKQNIANAIAASNQADADTVARANAWLAANAPTAPADPGPIKPPTPQS